MTCHHAFKDRLQRAARTPRRVEDLADAEPSLDFARPFMPEGLAWTESLDFLSAAEKLRLNQIRGHAYLAIFALVESFILPFVRGHARTGRAQPPLAAALVILHIEGMTQEHFLQSVSDDDGLEPTFKDLLRRRWIEGRDRTQLDAPPGYAKGLPQVEIDAAIEAYVALGGLLDEGLRRRAALDLAALERDSGRQLGLEDREIFLRVQHQANRWTYIGSGMSHPKVLAALEELNPGMRREIEAAAADLS